MWEVSILYINICIFFPIGSPVGGADFFFDKPKFFPQQKKSLKFLSGFLEFQKIQGHFTRFVLGYTSLVFQATSTSKVISKL